MRRGGLAPPVVLQAAPAKIPKLQAPKLEGRKLQAPKEARGGGGEESSRVKSRNPLRVAKRMT